MPGRPREASVALAAGPRSEEVGPVRRIRIVVSFALSLALSAATAAAVLADGMGPGFPR